MTSCAQSLASSRSELHGASAAGSEPQRHRESSVSGACVWPQPQGPWPDGSHLQQKLGVGDLLRPSALTQCREHRETLQASVLGAQLGAGGEGGVEAREPQSDCRGHVRGHGRASPSWSQLWPPALPCLSLWLHFLETPGVRSPVCRP